MRNRVRKTRSDEMGDQPWIKKMRQAFSSLRPRIIYVAQAKVFICYSCVRVCLLSIDVQLNAEAPWNSRRGFYWFSARSNKSQTQNQNTVNKLFWSYWSDITRPVWRLAIQQANQFPCPWHTVPYNWPMTRHTHEYEWMIGAAVLNFVGKEVVAGRSNW